MNAAVVPAFVLGLVIGSFLNVVIYRVPARRSVVEPPSACPSCETRLTALDLVPVFSWLALRGKCRHCSAPISSRYPLVELITATLFGLVAWRIGATWSLPAYLVFTAFLVALSGIDIDTKTLPNRLVYPAVGVGLVLLAVASLVDGEPRRMLWGAIGSLSVLVVFRLIHAVSPNGFGFGDVRLGALLGGHLGWLGLAYVPVGIYAGFVLGAVVGVGMMIGRRAGRRSAIPFGPFLAAGSLLAIVAGSSFVNTVWPL
jgi:leader peptidase (prepilin peptidase) / N-methyltransferase